LRRSEGESFGARASNRNAQAANSVCTLSPQFCGERVASAEGASRVRGNGAPN